MSTVAELLDDQACGPVGALDLGTGRPCRDSRMVRPGDLFFAWAADPIVRNEHIRAAVIAGAVAVVLGEEPPDELLVPAIRVADPRRAYAMACIRHHGLLQRDLRLFGVTGTDGKTSVSWMIWQLLGPGAARVGTLGWHDGHRARAGEHTSPPSDELCRFLAGLPGDCPGVALECSSHALHQQRFGDLPLDVLVVTGFGSDHLDYHGDRTAYLAAKLLAVDLVAEDGLVLVDGDDAEARELVGRRATGRGRRWQTLGWQPGCDWSLQAVADGVELSGGGGRWPVQAPAPGSFNGWNAAAAALAVAHRSGDLGSRCAATAGLSGAPGRLERVAERPLVLVDYAHTAAALQRVVAAVREAHRDRRLVCVFGCGGDRDRSKRGPMGRAALAADVAILTADNPRGEAQEAIAAEVIAGAGPDADRIRSLPDRATAIAVALQEAGPDGVVLICGKGHETEQEVAGVRRPWDDRLAVRHILAGEDV